MLNVEEIRSIPTGVRQSVHNGMLKEIFHNKYCKKCGLFERAANPYIEGRGRKDSPLLILGEAPGVEEDKQANIFFSGSLYKLLNEHDIQCYITNAVKCRPLDKKGGFKKATPTQIKCCNLFTNKIISEVKPKAILTLGKIAMDQLLHLNLAMNTTRGKQFYHPELNTTIVTTFHPSYLKMQGDRLLYKQFEEDLLTANEIAYGPFVRRLGAHPKSLKDPVEIIDFLHEVLLSKCVAIDIETDGLNPRVAKITDISFCIEEGVGVHVEWHDMIPHLELLNEITSNEDIEVIYHNGKFDVRFFRAVGLTIRNYKFDTLFAEHTQTMSVEGRAVFGLYKLKTMAWTHTDVGGYEDILGEEGIVGAIKERKKKKILGEDAPKDVEERTEYDKYAMLIEDIKQKKLEESGLNKVAYYSAIDPDVTLRIRNRQKFIIERDYKVVFENLIMPLANTLIRVEENGIRLDVDHINKMVNENEIRVKEIEEIIYGINGGEFDLNSNPTLKEFVFKKLKVKKIEKYKTPTGEYSLNEAAVTAYAETVPELALILERRKLNKQTSTYFEGFLEVMDPNTFRVHSSYLQHSTATGRLSCISPPLQTVPRDNRVRNMVIPSPGCKLLAADLSQAELRVLAMCSSDKEMIAAFEAGYDIHAATACNALLHITYEEFDKKNPEHSKARSIAKNINFGIVYGLSAYSLANDLGYPMDDPKDRYSSMAKAQKYIDSWFNLYSGAKSWLNAVKSFAITNGYVESVHGRRRYLPMVYSSDSKVREAALRQATNMPIQATASDITNFGLIRLQNWLDENNKKALIVGVVHDCILVDTPIDEVEEVGAALVRCLTHDIPLIDIELKADLDILDRWIKD